MPYTNSPENSTYKTVNMDFTATSWPRADNTVTGRDPEIVNMYYDRNSNENQTRDFVLKKRAGLTFSGISLNKSVSTDIVNGTFQDPNTGYIYWSVNNKVYKYNGSSVTLIATMGGAPPGDINGVGFCLFLTSTGTRYLMVNNGSQLWRINVITDAALQVTDIDLPSVMYPQMVFLDGYLFVAKYGSGDIYNSDLDDPTSWTPGNYITAEISPDTNLYITKIKNYLVCFGNEGIEFFYDSANPQGSPLSRNESYYKKVRLWSGVAEVNDELFFIGRSVNQGLRVFNLDGNNLKEISPNWVNRYLNTLVPPVVGEQPFYKVNVFPFSMGGHQFLGFSIQANFIIVYDLEENFWYKWTFGPSFNTTTNRIEGWVRDFSTNDSLLLLGGQVDFSKATDTVYQDFSINFTASYITEDVTQGTFNWKSCHRLGLYCDYPTISATSYAQVSWSDDDGNTWSTPRNLLVTTNNPYITQLGRFRSRNWKIEYTDNYPFRFWGISMDLNVGNI